MTVGEPRVVLAIDPGRRKCGVAIVSRDSRGSIEIESRAIVPREELLSKIAELLGTNAFSICLIGSGTTSDQLVTDVREGWPQVGVVLVDEKETTLEARELYWEKIGRRGWRRLLPASLQVPPEPIDDFAAVVIARRFLDPEGD